MVLPSRWVRRGRRRKTQPLQLNPKGNDHEGSSQLVHRFPPSCSPGPFRSARPGATRIPPVAERHSAAVGRRRGGPHLQGGQRSGLQSGVSHHHSEHDVLHGRRRRSRPGAVEDRWDQGGHDDGCGRQPRPEQLADRLFDQAERHPLLRRQRRRPRLGTVAERRHGGGHDDGRRHQPRTAQFHAALPDHRGRRDLPGGHYPGDRERVVGDGRQHRRHHARQGHPPRRRQFRHRLLDDGLRHPLLHRQRRHRTATNCGRATERRPAP